MCCRKTYYIGEQEFKTQVAAYTYTKNILSDITTGGQVCEGHRHFGFLCDLLQNHSEREEKIGSGVRKFIISQNRIRPVDRNNKPIYHIDIQRTDGSIIDFSWIKCAKSITGSHKEDLNKAFRYAIRDQMYEFRTGIQLICNICKKTELPEYHTDHKTIRFKDIVVDFLKITRQSIPKTFTEDHTTHQTIFKQEDDIFVNEWKQYHKQHADYQLLCRNCNLKKG